MSLPSPRWLRTACLVASLFDLGRGPYKAYSNVDLYLSRGTRTMFTTIGSLPQAELYFSKLTRHECPVINTSAGRRGWCCSWRSVLSSGTLLGFQQPDANDFLTRSLPLLVEPGAGLQLLRTLLQFADTSGEQPHIVTSKIFTIGSRLCRETWRTLEVPIWGMPL